MSVFELSPIVETAAPLLLKTPTKRVVVAVERSDVRVLTRSSPVHRRVQDDEELATRVVTDARALVEGRGRSSARSRALEEPA